MNVWDFADKHWLVAIILVALVIGMITRIARYAVVAYSRTLRHRSIRQYGWPKAPLDADGDVVYPEDKS